MSGYDFATIGGPPDPISLLRQLTVSDSSIPVEPANGIDDGGKHQEPPARCRPEVRNYTGIRLDTFPR